MKSFDLDMAFSGPREARSDGYERRNLFRHSVDDKDGETGGDSHRWSGQWLSYPEVVLVAWCRNQVQFAGMSLPRGALPLTYLPR